MGLRSRVADGLTRAAKAFGGPAPEAMRQAAEQTSQMDMAHPFAPGEPIGPYDGYSRVPRSKEYVTGYNIATRPRTHERVSFETLRGLIENYDVADICINHRIDSIRSLDWKLIAADHYDGDVADAITVGLKALDKPDHVNYFDVWLGKWLRDVLAYGGPALYRLRNRGGRCIGLMPVDVTSIAPLLDYWGNPPGAMAPPGEPLPEAFVQYVNGLPWGWLTLDDLIYEPFRLHNNSPYGRAPIESIILNANTDIRFQVYFLQRFTEGNLPAAFASAPETWSPQQIEQFQEYWDGFVYGDQSRKHQIRWIPGGSSFAWSDEKEFTDHFSLFLMRKTAAAYHVVPADLGFTENVNRSSGESQADVQHRVGDLPMLRYASRIITGFLQDDLGLPLKHQFDLGEEQVDRREQAEADKVYIDLGVVSPSEIREMRYGRPEPDGLAVPRFINSTRGGPIPLAALMAVAGPVDPATGAPMPGAELPHKVFGGVEGVLPVPPIKVMSLAEQEFGAGAMPPAPPPQPKMTAADVTPQLALPAAPVAKDGAPAAPAGTAAGITSETGIYSYDLSGRDDDEDDAPQTAGHVTVAVDPQRAAVAKEMAAFRRFERARRKAGMWRDFEFSAAGKVQAHRLNDAGRLAVRKAAGEIAVAGLAVLAEDTGRVLMLQRALCDDDPAAGKIEFPGGHLEEGESPLAAAWREFAEETGAVPPPGRETGSWTAGDGIYRGIVWTVESESLVPVRGGAVVPNPDDPDGDQVEAILWMDPADLAGNPAVRAELAASLDDVLAALGCSAAGSPEQGDGAICPCGVPVVYDELDGWQHADGSVSHDDGESVSDKMAAIAKAGDPGRPKDRKRREWPGWKLDGPTVAHWAPLVAEGIRRKLPPERLHRLASGYLTANPDQDGNAPGKRQRNEAAAAWLAVWLAGQGVTLAPDEDQSRGIVTDGWLIGGTSAAAMVTGLNADTGGWQPGDGEKARHRLEEIGAAAALAAALDSHSGDVAGYIAGGYAAELARVLAGADGTVSADVLAGVLADAIASEDVAAGLVLTQISTYTGMAAQDYYFANSVSLFQWVVDPSVKNCPVCLSNAAADPRRFGEAWPGGLPAPLQHPRCRCSLVPSGLG